MLVDVAAEIPVAQGAGLEVAVGAGNRVPTETLEPSRVPRALKAKVSGINGIVGIPGTGKSLVPNGVKPNGVNP